MDIRAAFFDLDGTLLDSMGMWAEIDRRSLGRRGIAVPDGLTVVGFDDVDYTTMLHPFLTTIRQPCTQLGEQSVRLLLELMQGRQPAQRQLTLPYQLIERESSARCAER